LAEGALDPVAPLSAGLAGCAGEAGTSLGAGPDVGGTGAGCATAAEAANAAAGIAANILISSTPFLFEMVEFDHRRRKSTDAS
jgi:hypothetical protein